MGDLMPLPPLDESRLHPHQRRVHPYERGETWAYWERAMYERLFANTPRPPRPAEPPLIPAYGKRDTYGMRTIPEGRHKL